MNITPADIADRLTKLGLVRGPNLSDMGVVWDTVPDADGVSGRWLVSHDPVEAIGQLTTIEAHLRGSPQVAVGRQQMVERIRFLRDSRARYLPAEMTLMEEKDNPISLQVRTLDSLLRVLTGDGFSMNSFAHSFDWEDYEKLVALQGDPLLTGVGASE